MKTLAEIVARITAKCQADPNSGCLLFEGAVTPKGYARVSFNGRNHPAHRLTWMHKHGREVPSGMVTCHLCDTPSCVNPDHLWVGSVAENNADCLAKGRVPHGQRAPNVRLTDAQVLAIRQRLDAGEHYKALALEHGVSRWTINKIQLGQRWRHVTETSA